MWFGEDREGAALPPADSAAQTRRKLLWTSIVAAAAAGLFAVAWTLVPYPSLLESPLVWLGLVAFWIAVFDLIYLAEIRQIERVVQRRPGLSIAGVRVLWFPKLALGFGQASLVVEVESSTPDYPANFSLFFDLNFTSSVYLVGLRCAWACKETGVLLLAPGQGRFMGGATLDSLDLPVPQLATLRGFLRPGAEWDGVPDWGRTAGRHAAPVLAGLRTDAWLFGPEQPYLGLEAVEGRLEKWWPPLVDRIVGLDAESALDLAKIVRAFDRDLRAGPAAA